MAHRKPYPPDGFVTLATAARLTGCATDPRLIADLVSMRLIDDVIVVTGGKRLVKVGDLDYIAAWVQFWNDRPQRPAQRKKKRCSS